MNKKRDDGSQLRIETEAKLASLIQTHENHALQKDELLHELRVHQIELDMQNEELRRTQLALEESRDRYVDLYEFAPVGYLTLTADGMIAKINLTATQLLGVEREKLMRRHFARYVMPEHSNRWHHYFIQVKQHVDKQQCELSLRRADGTDFYAYLDSVRIEIPDAPPLLRITITDISKLKLAEQQLRIAATVFESQQGISITDAKGLVIAVNHTFTKITGYTAEEVIGRSHHLLHSSHHDKDFYATLWNSIRHTGAWKGEIWNRRKNGEIYPEYINITAVKDQDGNICNYVATFDDITLSKLAADEIEQLAFYDPLTGLPNRRLLLDRLKQAMAASSHSGKKGALLFIDLDNFKMLNDTLGHDMGDLLLQQVAERLKTCVRENDTVARLGGDEFVVVLENISNQTIKVAAQTEVIGEKILATLNQPYQLATTHDYHNSPSIGATLFKGRQQSIEELLKQADIAMYQAKAAGRNALRFFDPQMQANITARIALEEDLRRALAENQFKLYYQLQMTHDRRIVGAEVFIRWQHPQRGLIMPADFISLAEDTGLIIPIGVWILETACAQLKLWENNECTQHLQLAVKVSAKQFRHSNFVEQVQQVLIRSGINPDRLKLEFPESLLLDNIDDTIRKMCVLRESGVRFSMNDFCIGCSSLSSLTQLPIDQLKIDGLFIRNIGVNPSHSMIVQTIIGMANNLGMEVIAEGVETETQRAFLERYNCLICQGYFFSQPLPIKQFECLLNVHERHEKMTEL